MAITALPTPPQRSDPANFASRGDAFMTALPTFATEANALAATVNADASTASAAATTATTQAGLASTSASNASTSASTATTKAAEAAASALAAMGSAAFVDTNPVVKGSADATKLMRFEVDGFTTATTRVVTVPNKDGTMAMTSDFAAPGPIGSTTPSTGAFTTLSATGQVTTTLSAGSSNNGTTNYAAYINTGTPSTANLIRLSGAVTSDVYIGRAASADTIIMGMVGSAPVATVSSTGIAVTGLVTSSAGRGTSFGYQLPDWRVYNTSSGNSLAFSNYTTDVMTLSSTGLAVTGTLNTTGQASVTPTSGPADLVLGSNTASGYSRIFMKGNSGQYNWKFANSDLVGDTLEFTPSTAAAGSTYTTPVMTISRTAVAVTGAVTATTTMNTGGYTVATLPAGSVGDRAYVTDATAPTFLGALTGGGAVRTPVFKNASAWVAA
jgi:hypothetical protein